MTPFDPKRKYPFYHPWSGFRGGIIIGVIIFVIAYVLDRWHPWL